MAEKNTVDSIRRNERLSHEQIYSTETLYEGDSWLRKPVKTVLDCLLYFDDEAELKILDLGCGVGRNSIAIARHFSDRSCMIDCVDILEIAIDKLLKNAERYGVTGRINGITAPIEAFPIPNDHYHWILAVSALEHIETEAQFLLKLNQIKSGLKSAGILCLIINSGVTERNIITQELVPAQFEVNLPTEELLNILSEIFSGWHVLKRRIQPQCYEIPRDSFTSELHSRVVTFVARKQ